MDSEISLIAPLFGFLGVTSAMGLSALGAAFATGKSAEGIIVTWVQYPRFGMRALIPIVMAGIIGIYGLVVSIVIAGKITSHDYTLFMGFSHFAAGLSCGGCSLGAGYAVGITGDCGTRSLGHEPKNFIGFILIWAWGQLLGLYGLLVALVVAK